MGGYGSGCRYGASPKQTVESCVVLSAAKLQSDGLIKAGQNGGGSLVWWRISTGEQTASISYYVTTLDGPPTIRLRYTSTRRGENEGQRMDYSVALTTTPLPWGGVRWWFRCPLVVNGQACWRRCGKLYLPPGGYYFGCRLCYDLTYTSAQEAHKFDGLYGMIAADLGVTPEVIKLVMKK